MSVIADGATWPWDTERTPFDELWALLAPPAWHASAACRDRPDLNFFPRAGEDTGPALAVCAGCPVAEQCRAFALAQDEPMVGIWAGTSQRQRRRLRAESAAAVPIAAAKVARVRTPAPARCVTCGVVASSYRGGECPKCSMWRYRHGGRRAAGG